MKLSVIVAVLNSHKVFGLQLKLWKRIMPDIDCELIVVDDGSDPPLKCATEMPSWFKLVASNDFRPWTQPLARNLAAAQSKADYLLMTDIDKILTVKAVEFAMNFTGTLSYFRQQYAILNDDGWIVPEEGQASHDSGGATFHRNSFLIKRKAFNKFGGYSERSAGKYGDDTRDISKKLFKLEKSGLGPVMYAYKNSHVNDLFHGLKRP